MWMAGTSPSTIERAAANGLGVLFFAHGMLPEQLATSVSEYRKLIKDADPIGRVVNNRLAGFVNGLCGEDDAETKRVAGVAAFEYMLMGMRQSRWPKGEQPPRSYEYTVEQMWQGEELFRQIGPDGMIEQGMIMAGNPDRCNEIVKRYADVGVDQLIIHMQASDTPHERIMESIRLFGTHVIPEYR